jgi:hypothetical protein
VRRNFSKIKSHSFQEKRYEIVWRRPHVDNDGQCDAPDTIGKRIYIAPNLPEFDLLEAVLHEMDHACYFNLDEPSVERAAADKARLLWRMGWRLP